MSTQTNIAHETAAETNHTLSTEPGVWPADRTETDRWLTYKITEDRKIPRAPFAYTDYPDRFVNAHDPDHWASFDTANEWTDALPGHQIAYDIRPREEHPAEDLILLDYDDVRDPETGDIHPTVIEHIETAGTYAAVSQSGTGVHVLGIAPEGLRDDGAIESPLDLPDPDTDDADGHAHPQFPDAEIEGYDSARFVGLTGGHITTTPDECRDIQGFIDDLTDEYATVSEGSPAAEQTEPATSKAELAEIETTTDMQDVYDAVDQTTPRDIRLRSTVTNDRTDAKDLDPSWANSNSGTRLAQLEDGWVYRQGMHGLDALQVVALEERLITSESDYPDGKDFFTALDALRDRGAHIPHYVNEDVADGNVSDVQFDGPDPDADETILALAGKLQFSATRSAYTICCPGCETALATDETATHDDGCSVGDVDMEVLLGAYQTILTLLDDQPRTRDGLRSEASEWGPVHSRVLSYLTDEGTVAPAGGDR